MNGSNLGTSRGEVSNLSPVYLVCIFFYHVPIILTYVNFLIKCQNIEQAQIILSNTAILCMYSTFEIPALDQII